MARKNIYQNRLGYIKELRQARNKDLIVDFVSQQAKQINQRFYRLEKAGKGKDTAYYYAQQETGKDKPRYPTYKPTLENMSIDELLELAKDINNKLVSRTSTVSGQKEVEERRIETSMEALGIEEDKKEIFKRFLKDGGGKTLNKYKKYLDSKIFFEMWENAYDRNISNEDFLNEFNQYVNKNEELDVGKIRRRLNNLAKAKRKKK